MSASIPLGARWTTGVGPVHCFPIIIIVSELSIMLLNNNFCGVSCFIGIQQWRLDSDTSSPSLQKKDEVDSLQSCLNDIPMKMKVFITLSLLPLLSLSLLL